MNVIVTIVTLSEVLSRRKCLLFILGKNVYRGKMNALEGIPIKIDDRKKKVKKDLQDKINNYIDSLINTNKFEKKLEEIIEFSLDIDSID